MSSPVEQIKARLSIVDVVGSYLKLEKAGGNFKACCPFHNEKTPSFMVSPSRDTFHCFGCSKGGDILTFVEEIEGLDFLGALQVLADRAGIELKPVDFKLKSQNEKLYTILEEAAKYYEYVLEGDGEATAYLAKRGVKPETIKAFRLGYSKDEWQGLFNHLTGKGFSSEDIELAGLAIKSEKNPGALQKRYYDRFRGRVMFPLSDTSGRVVGFSGRILKTGDVEAAKYVNSPQTPLYDKSLVLFGYDKAKTEIKKKNYCILVEGQMDLIMSHQAGETNAVAVSGTALTEKHLGLIKRLSENLVLVFDADDAGIAASRRAVDLAFFLAMEVKAALLPAGKDPADVILEDPKKWTEAVEKAKNVIDFYIDVLDQKKLEVRVRNQWATKEILPLVAKLGNAIDQAHFVSKLVSVLGTRDDAVWEELKKLPPSHKASAGQGKAEISLPPKKIARAGMLLDRLFGLLYWQETVKDSSFNIQEKWSSLEEILGKEAFAAEKAERDGFKERMILEMEMVYGETANPGSAFDEIKSSYRESVLREELQATMGKLKEAERQGDNAKLEEYLKKCQTISIEINNLKK